MAPKDDPLLGALFAFLAPFVTLSYISFYVGILLVGLIIVAIVVLFIYLKFKFLRKSRQQDTIGKCLLQKVWEINKELNLIL